MTVSPEWLVSAAVVLYVWSQNAHRERLADINDEGQ